MPFYPKISILLCFLLSLGACASHRITVAEPNPTGKEQSETSKSIAFGNVQPRTVVKCSTNLIDEVTIKLNFGQTLASIITLGIYQPITVRYRCANIPSAAGSTDE